MKNCTRTWRKWYVHATLLFLFFLSSFTGFSQLVAKGLTASNGTFIGFYQYTPYDYNPTQQPKYPLIIFLHGIGERGNGTTDLPSVLNNGTPRNIKEGHTMRFFWNGKWETFLVLIPQLSNNYGWWQNFYVDEMIKYAKANLNVDPDRITLTGLSLGGGGTWAWPIASLANAQTLNCIGVSCGTCPNTSLFPNMVNANLPIWAFHASNDGQVGAGCTTGAISAINALNPAVKPYMTIWPDGGHTIWGRVYDTEYNWQNPNIYEWFLGQNRSLPVNKRPVADAGTQQTITTGLGTVTLDASGSTDPDGNIVRYIWTKLSGPNYGTITTSVSTNGKTTVTGLISAGTYEYQVKVVDNRADWTFATVKIIVNPGAGPNQAPTANAGADITINQPATTATLNGTASFDPEGRMNSYTWTKVDGPAGGNITNASSATATANSLALGTYTFKLEVKDAEGLSGSDEVKVTVNGPNQRGIPVAGPDIVLTLPTNNTTLNGSGSYDPDGPIAKYEWAKLTGPPNFTIASPNASSTALTGLAQGVYTFKLTIWDNLWVPASDTLQITVNAATSNQPPTARAGNDITVTYPANSTTLNGSGSTDPNGNNTITYSWTKVGGPGQFTLANANAASTALSNLAAGTYKFRLQVTDNGGLSDADTVTVTVSGPPNQAPAANAGSDLTITLPNNSVTLDGSGSSDQDGPISSYGWSRITGPTQLTFANASAATTLLSDLVEGTYVINLVVRDNYGAWDNDTIVVTVKPAPVNQAPVAKAGTDINITLPVSNTTLDGAASTDADGTIVGYSWAWISGPTQYTLGNSGAVSTSLSNLVAGTYAFQLTVTDNGGQIGKDTIRVIVTPAPVVNQPPVAKAGADISLNLPTNNTTLNGSASTDADGTITVWAWAKIYGPANYTLSANNIASPALSNLELGTYAFELTVTDDDGAVTTDTIMVTVNPEPPTNNQPPVAAAGNDITITLPTNSVTLDGTGSHDPDGTIAAYQWFYISGPSQYTLANDKATTTQLSNLVAGTYQFKLRVWDGAWAPSDDTIKIVVNPEPNRAPVANAGSDITITLPVNNTTLNGSASTDPNGNNTIATYTWTRISGPTQHTLANANAATTALSNLVQGTYAFELSVTDNGGLNDKDTVQVTVNPRPNRAPVANAGNDITITLPVNNTTLNGTTSSDPDGNNTITNYTWTKLTGPTQYNVANANAATTALNNLVQGTYTFELSITDNGGLNDKDTVTVVVRPIPNRAPVANAGADVNIPLPNNSTTLNGTASTDPDGNNTIVSYAWTLVNGPAQYTLANPNAATTLLSNLVEGTYTFELKVTDNGGLTSTDIVAITVSPIPNRAPLADAGDDRTIALPTNSITLDGTGSSDPEGNNTIASYYWSQVSGPAQYTLGDPGSPTTTLSNLVEGTYTFELTVTDNRGLSDDDIVVITVSPNPNRAPLANAGADITLTLPTNSTTLNGSASSDPDGNNTITYSWSKIDGPGQFTIANALAASTALSDLAEGVYTFVLTVTDNYNITDKDTVKVSVVMPPNVLPVAHAGTDITVSLPDPVIVLDGTASADSDGNIVSYTWTKTNGPGALTIINAASSKATIVGVEAGVYEFELTVTDNRGGIAKDRVKVTVLGKENKKPIANAGKDQTIAVPATTATLNGHLSYDEDGILNNFAWKQVKGPAAASISGNTMITTVSNLQPGDYEFELTITDADGASATDTVMVSVVNNLRYTESISIYPNPTQGASQVTVRCITDTLGVATLTVMDQFGRPVEVHTRNKTQAYQEFPIIISHLRNGNYYIEVQIERKKRMVAKFIKR